MFVLTYHFEYISVKIRSLHDSRSKEEGWEGGEGGVGVLSLSASLNREPAQKVQGGVPARLSASLCASKCNIIE